MIAAQTKDFSSSTNDVRNKILIADDEAYIRELLATVLQEKYDVVLAPDGTEAVEVAKREQPDLIIMDVMMPGLDGYQACEVLRNDGSTKDIPIVMLTAIHDTANRVKAFTSGADDHIAKPFVVEELLARVESKIKRHPRGHEKKGAPLECGNLTIRPESFEVTVAGREVKLTVLEFNLLTYMVQNHGRLLSRKEILKTVWKSDEAPLRVLDWHILCLRRKLAGFDYKIQSVYGAGYILKQDSSKA